MKKSYFVIAGLTGFVLLLIALFVSTPSTSPTTTLSTATTDIVQNDEQAGTTSVSEGTTETTTASEEEPWVTEARAKLAQQEDFYQTRDRLEAFINTAPDMNDEERNRQKVAMMAEIDQLEKAAKVTAAESLFLKLALIKTNPNEEEAKRQGEELVAALKALSEQRLQAFVDNPDPVFVDYKSKEKDVVKEVMAMTEFPNDMSRDQYLAYRLQELRNEVYAVE